MEQPHRNAIRKSWTTIVNSLTSDQVDIIVDNLTEQNMLTMGMRETILCEHRTTAKIRALLGIVQKRGPCAFQSLVDSLLKSGANHVTDVLLSNVDEPVEETRNVRSTLTCTEENQSVSEHGTCTICMDNSISVAFDPCGHTFCSPCGERILRQRTCCYCHQSVARLMRIYIG